MGIKTTRKQAFIANISAISLHHIFLLFYSSIEFQLWTFV